MRSGAAEARAEEAQAEPLGLDLKVIQEILGHSTITITANLYAHVLIGLKREAANQMDVLLGDASEDDRDGVNLLRKTGRVAPAMN